MERGASVRNRNAIDKAARGVCCRRVFGGREVRGGVPVGSSKKNSGAAGLAQTRARRVQREVEVEGRVGVGQRVVTDLIAWAPEGEWQKLAGVEEGGQGGGRWWCSRRFGRSCVQWSGWSAHGVDGPCSCAGFVGVWPSQRAKPKSDSGERGADSQQRQRRPAKASEQEKKRWGGGSAGRAGLGCSRCARIGGAATGRICGGERGERAAGEWLSENRRGGRAARVKDSRPGESPRGIGSCVAVRCRPRPSQTCSLGGD